MGVGVGGAAWLGQCWEWEDRRPEVNSSRDRQASACKCCACTPRDVGSPSIVSKDLFLRPSGTLTRIGNKMLFEMASKG